MSNEEIERNFRIVAENHVQHSEDIKQIDQSIAVLNRNVNVIAEKLIGIEDKIGENTQVFNSFLPHFFESNRKLDERLNRLVEAQFKTDDQIIKANGRLDRIEATLIRLAEAQIKTDKLIKGSPKARKPSKKSATK